MLYLSTQIYLNNNPNYWVRLGYFIGKLHLDIRYLFPGVEVEWYFPVAAGITGNIFHNIVLLFLLVLIFSLAVFTTAEFFLYSALLKCCMYPRYLWRSCRCFSISALLLQPLDLDDRLNFCLNMVFRAFKINSEAMKKTASSEWKSGKGSYSKSIRMSHCFFRKSKGEKPITLFFSLLLWLLFCFALFPELRGDNRTMYMAQRPSTAGHITTSVLWESHEFIVGFNLSVGTYVNL